MERSNQAPSSSRVVARRTSDSCCHIMPGSFRDLSSYTTGSQASFQVMSGSSTSSSTFVLNRGSDGWQLNRSFMERHKYMYQSKMAADVRFLVGSPDGDTEQQEIVAHKYMLVSCSPVFEAMLDPSWRQQQPKGGSGEGALGAGRIEIPDILPDAFNEMLRYIYYEEAKITVKNAFGVLYAAKKYQLPGLENLSKSFILKNIRGENVCMFLDQSLQCAEDTISFSCLKYIETHAVAVLQSPEVLTLSKKAFLRIVRNDDLQVDSEKQVYDACIKWAMEQCKYAESAASDASVRASLGEVLYCIRFPCMSKEHLLTITQNTNVLSKDEKIEIYESMLGPRGAGIGLFESRPRHSQSESVSVQMSRYKTVTRGYWLAQNSKTTHAISFTLDQNACMVGIGMFTSSLVQPIHILAEIYDQNLFLVARITGHNLTRNQYNHQCQDYEFSICGWHFADPVALSAGQLYTVVARENYQTRMDDIPATIGMNGLVKITANGLTIEFQDAKNIAHNGTKVHTGQIPQLLFKFNPRK